MKYVYIALTFLTLLYFFLRDNNKYCLTMIFGKKGSGKSSHIAKLSQKYIKQGRKVYTNFDVSGCYQYDPSDIGLSTFEPDSVVFLDEIGLIYNNRDYKNFKKCVMEWFKFQRKYKITMYIYSQSYEDTDKCIRLLIDRLALLERFGKISVYKPITKVIGVGTDSNGNGNIVDSYKILPFPTWQYTYLPRYYGLFSSFNPPELPILESVYKDYDEFSTIYTDTKKWLLYTLKMQYNAIYEFLKKVILKWSSKLKRD